MSKWCIRDVKHGKTYSFDSFEEMVEWIYRAAAHLVPKHIK